MTSSANDIWVYGDLLMGIEALEKVAATAPNNIISKQLIHEKEFIEYNMNEMEITGGNGD